MKTKIMFDTQAFDLLLEKAIKEDIIQQIENSLNKFEYYITSVQIEELAKIPDAKKEKRIELLLLLCCMNSTLVNTAFVFDYSRFGYCEFCDETDNIYEKLLNKNNSNVCDALIGEAASRNECVVVSNDTKFKTKLNSCGIMNLSFDEFYEMIRRN